MFKVEEDNRKIGMYLADRIKQKYPSIRAFCKAYITERGEDAADITTVNNMANRLAQIIKGKNAIQTNDLPHFTKLLNISCEQLLSAGRYAVPLVNRVTNYSVASSKDPKVWEEYIQRQDKLILNTDEYCRTVLDYALEFENYPFIKYLMGHNYIWFDSRKDNDYIMTFGAGTSIQRRSPEAMDYGLPRQLREEDELRTNMIALAAKNNDIGMLNELRARENPQLYFKAHYLYLSVPELNDKCADRMVQHIATAGNTVLDYFTDSFDICDKVRYKDGSNRHHTFLFPYISQLLDALIAAKSSFAETALKKAIAYNRKTYARLCELVHIVKNSEKYSIEYLKDLWISDCERDFRFFVDGNFVIFSTYWAANKTLEGIITNVAQVTKMPICPDLKPLAEELNESYDSIKNFKEKIKEL